MRNKTRNAFTLIESIVVILVVLIIAAIFLSSLGNARRLARQTRVLAVAADSVKVLDFYLESNKELFPFAAVRGDPFGPITIDGAIVPGDYFAQSAWWAWIAKDYVTITNDLIFAGNSLSSNKPLRSSFDLTQAAFADSSYWLSDVAPEDLNLFRPMPRHEIRYPASKALLLSVTVGIFDETSQQSRELGTIIVATADGAARPRQHLTHDSDPARIVERPFGAIPWLGMSTRGGFSVPDY